MQDSDRGEGSSRARRVGKTGKNATTADRLVPSEMPLALVNLVDTVFEDGDFEEVFGLLQGLTNQWYLPDVNHILQLVALIIDPEACIKFRNPVDQADEHDIYYISHTTAVQRARQILQDWIDECGPERILQAIPRRVSDDDIRQRGADDDVYAGAQPLRRNLADDLDNAPSENQRKQMLEDQTRFQKSAIRLTECSDVWQVLAGKSRRRASGSSRDKGKQAELAILPNAWALLELLLSAWEMEQRKVVQNAENGNADSKPYSPSLLTQFPASTFGPPSDAKDALRVVFARWNANEGKDSTACRRNRKLSLRLLDLLVSLANAGKFDSGAMIQQIVEQLGSLSANALQEWIQMALPRRPEFKIRLLMRYLQRHAKAADTNVHTKSGSSVSLLSLSCEEAITAYLSRIPRDLVDRNGLAPRAMKTFRNRTATPEGMLNAEDAPLSTPTQVAFESMLRFTVVKLGLLEIWLSKADQVKEDQQAWSAALQDGRVLQALRMGRQVFLDEFSIDGKVEKQLVDLEAFEEAEVERLLDR